MSAIALPTATLSELELIIDRGKQVFFEVGAALAQIRERKLYREAGFATFEDYCQKRHGFSASRGRQLIAAAATVTAVTLSGGTPPATEREARALAAAQRAHDLVMKGNCPDVLDDVLDAVRQFQESVPGDDLEADVARAKRALKALEMVMTATWNDAPVLAALARFSSDIANLMAECRLRCERSAGLLLRSAPA
jgi:hypothetical protein